MLHIVSTFNIMEQHKVSCFVVASTEKSNTSSYSMLRRHVRSGHIVLESQECIFARTADNDATVLLGRMWMFLDSKEFLAALM